MPEARSTLRAQRNAIGEYRMIGMEAHLAPDGSLEISGDVMGLSRLEISSS